MIVKYLLSYKIEKRKMTSYRIEQRKIIHVAKAN